MSDEAILIVAGKDGWKPQRKVVLRYLDEMQVKGLRTDWKYCLVMATRALMFADDSDSEHESSIIAYKGEFLTEREYLEHD